MRMPRSLGVVATAFLALGLGVGIGGAAFSNYFASSGSSAGGAYALGATQWHDPNAKAVPGRVDHARPERGAVDGKDHRKDPTRHGDARRSNDRGAKKADGGVSHHDVTRYWTGNSWTGQRSNNVEARPTSVFTPVGSSGPAAPSSQAKPASAAPSSPRGTDQKPKPVRGDVAENDSKAGPGARDVPQNGTKKKGTRQEARSASTTKQVTVYVAVSVPGTGSRAGVTQSRSARTTTSSSDTNRTNRDRNQARQIRGAGDTHAFPDTGANGPDRSSASSATTELLDLYALITVGVGGDGGGQVPRDISASTHSPWPHGNDPGPNARGWHASRSGPDHSRKVNSLNR